MLLNLGAKLRQIAQTTKLFTSFFTSRMINMGAYTVDTETHVLSFRGCNEKTLGNTEFATLKPKDVKQ